MAMVKLFGNEKLIPVDILLPVTSLYLLYTQCALSPLYKLHSMIQVVF